MDFFRVVNKYDSEHFPDLIPKELTRAVFRVNREGSGNGNGVIRLLGSLSFCLNVIDHVPTIFFRLVS